MNGRKWPMCWSSTPLLKSSGPFLLSLFCFSFSSFTMGIICSHLSRLLCFPERWPTRCAGAWDHPARGTGLLFLFVKLWGFCCSISPAFQDPSINGSATAGVSSSCSHFICSLLRVQPVPSSRSLLSMLNSIIPSVHPWGTPLVPALQLGFVVLVRTTWAQFSQFSAHLIAHLSSLYFTGLPMKMSWGQLLKI